MPLESDKHYFLPEHLREKLSYPIGELIEGSIEETSPQLKQRLEDRDHILVGVGDVTAELLVELGLEPEIVITDGKTKRVAISEPLKFPGYHMLYAVCPAAEITPDAWKILRHAIVLAKVGKVHVMIDGEEDLLVLPLIVELEPGSIIVYGQPNKGAVIRIVDENAKEYARSILNAMDIK